MRAYYYVSIFLNLVCITEYQNVYYQKRKNTADVCHIKQSSLNK
jgi:hypothetical protein